MLQAFSNTDINERLADLNASLKIPWKLKNGKLHKTFVFSNFIDAFAFMGRVALYAEKINHHPEWYNVYKTVEVALMTHEATGITQRDFELAQFMEAST
jgi:4a-hydroxytetrahydrobiopterin dehydratase